jgi:two-component system KDP operon response regulator KdpE
VSATHPTILVVEDERQMRRFVNITLSAHDYEVIEAETIADGIREASSYTPDLVLLDLGLPDADGLEFIRRVREWSPMPIIVISARGKEDDKVLALDAGADDYVTKPFGASELLARIRVALRHAVRSGESAATAIAIGEDVRVDLVKRIVVVRGEEVHLTPIEYKLLALLLKHAGLVVTHKQMLDQVWGPGHAHQMQYLRVYMTQLRHKLERTPAHPKHLVTEAGVGYRLRLD